MHKTDQGVGGERPGLLKMQQVHRQVLRNKTARHKEKNWMRTFKKKKNTKACGITHYKQTEQSKAALDRVFGRIDEGEKKWW